jgi:hypothetical protein
MVSCGQPVRPLAVPRPTNLAQRLTGPAIVAVLLFVASLPLALQPRKSSWPNAFRPEVLMCRSCGG